MLNYKRVCAQFLGHVRLCDPTDCTAHQAPPSLGFSRQEHWSGLPLPPPGMEPASRVSCIGRWVLYYCAS